MTLLSIVQGVALRCGITPPVGAISNSDPTIQQIIALVQDEGDEDAANYDWRNIKIACNFTGDGTTTNWALPADFDRWPTAGACFWSASYPMIPLQGPISDTDLMAMQALPVKPVRPVWNMIGPELYVWPALAAGEVVSGQYRSTNWILSGADGVTRQAVWLADTDTALINERVIMLGAIWRWKRAKGLDYAEDMKTWSSALEVAAAHDRGNRTVNMARAWNFDPSNFWPGIIQVP
jgi:hypothetical protein